MTNPEMNEREYLPVWQASDSFPTLYKEEEQRDENINKWTGKGLNPKIVCKVLVDLVGGVYKELHSRETFYHCHYNARLAVQHCFFSLYAREEEQRMKDGYKWTGEGYDPVCVHKALVGMLVEIYNNPTRKYTTLAS